MVVRPARVTGSNSHHHACFIHLAIFMIHPSILIPLKSQVKRTSWFTGGKNPPYFTQKSSLFVLEKKKSSLLISSSSSLSKTMTFIVLQTELLEVWDCLKENQNPDFGMGFSYSFVKKHMLAFFFKHKIFLNLLIKFIHRMYYQKNE